MQREILKYQKYRAIYIVKNEFDSSYLILNILFLFIVLYCFFTNFGSIKNVIIFYTNYPSLLFPIIIGEVTILTFFLFYLYEFFNFRIIVTPEEIILKTYKEEKIIINKISEIGKYYSQKSVTSIEIICIDGKKYRYPINCNIKKLINYLNQINPNIKMTNKSILFENLFN